MIKQQSGTGLCRMAPPENKGGNNKPKLLAGPWGEAGTAGFSAISLCLL